VVREAIILAGGSGTRLLPLIADRPKPLAPVAGRPFVEWLLLSLRLQGIQRVILASGHLGDVVDRHFQGRNDLGLEVLICREQSTLGTGGAARNALSLTSGELVAVLNGDSYCTFDLRKLSTVHIDRKSRASLWLVAMDDSSRYGTVKVDRQNRVVAFAEKSSQLGPGLINAGVYLFNRQELARIPSGRAVSLEREIIPGLIENGVHGEIGPGPFLDIGTPESYLKATEYLKQTFDGLLAA
jgi:NDP-sugar pyrophosphorylase family protein